MYFMGTCFYFNAHVNKKMANFGLAYFALLGIY